jgi:hypothetical protein
LFWGWLFSGAGAAFARIPSRWMKNSFSHKEFAGNEGHQLVLFGNEVSTQTGFSGLIGRKFFGIVSASSALDFP